MGGIESAVSEGAGPMRPDRRPMQVIEGQNVPRGSVGGETAVDGEEAHKERGWLPNGSGHMQSAIGRELSEEKCGIDGAESGEKSPV